MKLRIIQYTFIWTVFTTIVEKKAKESNLYHINSIHFFPKKSQRTLKIELIKSILSKKNNLNYCFFNPKILRPEKAIFKLKLFSVSVKLFSFILTCPVEFQLTGKIIFLYNPPWYTSMHQMIL